MIRVTLAREGAECRVCSGHDDVRDVEIAQDDAAGAERKISALRLCRSHRAALGAAVMPVPRPLAQAIDGLVLGVTYHLQTMFGTAEGTKFDGEAREGAARAELEAAIAVELERLRKLGRDALAEWQRAEESLVTARGGGRVPLTMISGMLAQIEVKS